jgi:hypothetical protein
MLLDFDFSCVERYNFTFTYFISYSVDRLLATANYLFL